MITHTRRIDGDPDQVFATLTDLHALPRWNRAIIRVLEAPHDPVPGAEWVVEWSVLGQRRLSRSRLEVCDTADRTFRYRSGSDDGNPSYADWEWTVAPAAGGSEVTVTCRLAPQTFWRRVLLSPMRQRQLRRTELPQSLADLGELITSTT